MRLGLNVSLPLTGRLNPFGSYAIGEKTPQTIADFEADKYASANKNLGPELVTNGTFDSDSDWSFVPNWSIGSGVASHTSGAFSSLVQTVDSLGVGKLFLIEFDLTTSAGSIFGDIRLGGVTGSSSVVTNIPSGNRRVSVVGFQEQAGTNLVFVANANFTGTVDNISVREVVSYSPASTTAESLLTHTRSGNAVQVADDGTLQWAGHNLLTYSEDFSNAAWSKSNVTVTPNATTAPDGTLTADKVINTGDTSGKLLYQNPSTSGQQTVGVFAKAAEFSRLRINELGGNRFSANFDLSAETATLTSGVDGIAARITSVGNGWYLCEIDHNRTIPAINVVGYPASAEVTAGNPNYDADDTSGIYVWGAHLYRSDLGGMADIPTSYRGLSSSSTYLPTTSAARYLPRVDNHIWDGSSWVKRCLVEPQSTNLFDYSNITDAEWGAGGTSSNATLSEGQLEDLGLSFSKVTATAVFGTHFVSDKFTVPASVTTYTCSVFAKADTSNFLFIRVVGGTPGLDAQYVINLSNGSVAQTITAGDATPLIEEVSSGVYRVSVTDTTNGSAGSPSLQVGPHNGGTSAFWSAAGTEAVFVAGAQVEASPVPTSYIPTAGSQVTRPADALSIDSTLLPYDSTAMTIALEYNITGDDGTLFNWEADASNKITASVASGAYTFTQIAAGTSDSVTGGTLADGTNTAASVASRHTDGDINAAIDGTALTVNSTVTALADLSASDFEIAPSTALNIKTVRVLGGYGADDAELEAAT